MDSLVHDLRYALRTLRKSPGFALVAVLTLALGIGANTAIFSAVDSLLLRPLPYADPNGLVSLSMAPETSVSKATLVGLRERSRTFEDIAAYSGWGFVLTGEGEPEALTGARASTNLFDVLGAPPLLGRTFLAEESEPGRDRVAVLSYGFWLRRFGGDPGVAGQALTLNGDPHTVVGVMPAGFHFPSREAELWLPAPLDPGNANDYTAGYLTLVGRLQPGVTREQARAEVRAIARQLREAAPDWYAEDFGERAFAVPLRDALLGDVKLMLLLLLGTVGLVLLIACANVASLLLTRAAARGKEMAIRTALGAGRARLVRQLLTESVLLAVLGGAVGLLVALLGTDLLRFALPAELPRAGEIGLDGRVFTFALALSLLVGIVFGLAPALRGSRSDLQATLKESGRGASAGAGRRRLLGSLVIGEIALALVLVIGAGLMLQTVWKLRSEDPGFRAGGVLSLQLLLPSTIYPEAHQRVEFYRQALERIEALPGVESAGAIHLLPLGGSNWGAGLRIEGRLTAAGEPLPETDWRAATTDYFQTLQIPLLRGRLFSEQDHQGAPGVALVNAALARRYFSGEDPIGKQIWTDFEGEGNWVTIVGVVGDTRDLSVAGPPRPQMYRPHAQTPIGRMTVMVRTASDPLQLAGPVREAVWSVGRDGPISEVQPLERVVAESIAQPRLFMLLLVIFGGLALVLGTVGIYGVISYAVGQRMHEFGIRMALGARTGDVLRLVVWQGAALALAGVVIGLVLAFAATRLLSSLLYQVSATDPWVFSGITLLLLGVALLASYLPARCATRVDPMIVLRME